MKRDRSFGRRFISAGILLLGISGAAVAVGDDPVPSQPPIECEPAGFGFMARADRALYSAGETLHAHLALFNDACSSVWGYESWGGAGCGFDFQILDSQGRVVHQEYGICPMYAEGDAAPSVMPIGPSELPHGGVLAGDHELALVSAGSETGEPDGTPLPVGNYLLRAVLYWSGPAAGADPATWEGSAGNPEARIPFRIDQGAEEPPVVVLPFDTVDQGQVSFYRYGDVSFTGEDLAIRSTRDWRSFWRSHSGRIFPPPPSPRIDFSERMVLATLMGFQNYGGASVTVTRVLETADQIRVFVRHDLPGMAIDMITNPFHIVTIPYSDKEVVFEHENGYPPPPAPCCVGPAETGGAVGTATD